MSLLQAVFLGCAEGTRTAPLLPGEKTVLIDPGITPLLLNISVMSSVVFPFRAHGRCGAPMDLEVLAESWVLREPF